MASNSQYHGPLKWAYEFMKKKKDAKPLKIVDYCSQYNNKGSIWDEVDGKKDIDKLEFVGIRCECFNDRNAANCDHAIAMADKNLLAMGK